MSSAAAYRRTQKLAIEKLEAQHNALQQQVQQLLQEKTALQFRASLLTNWCQELTLLQLKKACEDPDTPLASNERMQQLAEEELGLLQDLLLSAGPHPTVQRMSLVPSLVDQAITPANDPSALIRELLSKPVPEAMTMTAKDLAASYRAIVLESGVQLNKLRAAEAIPGHHQQQQAAIGRIKTLMMEHLARLTHLILLDRNDVVEGMKLFDLESMTPCEYTLEESEHQEILAAMELSEEQEEAIAQGFAVMAVLLQPIMQEWHELQQHVGKALVNAKNISNNPPDRDSSSSSSSTSKGSATLASLSAKPCSSGAFTSTTQALDKRAEDLEAEEKRLARIHLVMHKRYVILLVGNAWFISCLAWKQVAQMTQVAWPHTPELSRLAAAVQRGWEARQRQQQQQV